MKKYVSAALALALCSGLSAPAFAAAVPTGTAALAIRGANPMPYAATVSTSFTDVPTSHWAYLYIAKAAEKGWVSGTGNGKYNPTGTVTAAEFLSMVVRAFYPGEADAITGGIRITSWRITIM